MPVSKETLKWVKTASDELAVKQGCYFDLASAERVRQFFSLFCRHTKGQFAGKPFELLPWQWERIIAPVFGWKMPDGTRRFRRCDCFVPKKNGKSTLTAGVALYLLIADNEYGAEVYLAASDRNQASIVYNESATMVEISPALDSVLAVRRSKKMIEFKEAASFIKALSADASKNEGYNIHGLVFDELHTQRNRRLWSALKFGGASRTQPILFSISTAGEHDETSLWWEVHKYAKALQESKEVDIHTLGVVYGMDDGDDWTKESTWKKCNPSYGTTINPVEFRQAFEGALKNGAAESEFLRYRLNKATKHESSWIQNHFWVANTYKGKNKLNYAMYNEVYAGIDLSDNLDLNAFQEFAIDKAKDTYATKGMYWCPESVLHSGKPNAERYRLFVELNALRVIPGAIADYKVIIDDIIDYLTDAEYIVSEIAIDRFQAVQFAYELQAKLRKAGLSTKVRAVGYNYVSMNEPTRLLEKAIIGGKLKHENNPVLNWMFSNIVCTTDSSGNRKLDKGSRMSKGKIDGFAALCLAILAWIENSKAVMPSKYENEKLSVLSI